MAVALVLGESVLADRLTVALRAARKGMVVQLKKADMDIFSDRQVMEAVCGFWPSVVINCINSGDPIPAESKKDLHLVMQQNSFGPGRIAVACQGINAFMVHLSTDLVFGGGGHVGPYQVSDRPIPIQIFGQSCLWGEMAVHSLSARGRYMIVRLPPTYGMGSGSPAERARESGILRTKGGHEGFIRPDIWANALTTPAYVEHVAQRIAYHVAGWNLFDGVVLPTRSRLAHIQHCAPAEPPVSWYALLVPKLPLITPASAPPRPGFPAVGGLVPSIGWELPSYEVGLKDFMDERIVDGPDGVGGGQGEGPR